MESVDNHLRFSHKKITKREQLIFLVNHIWLMKCVLLEKTADIWQLAGMDWAHAALRDTVTPLIDKSWL